jgi:hypothetical protein
MASRRRHWHLNLLHNSRIRRRGPQIDRPPRGTWTYVDGEARIAWDDGWHDIIRKVGATHEKRAFEPGKSFDDTPSNITAAKNTETKPI